MKFLVIARPRPINQQTLTSQTLQAALDTVNSQLKSGIAPQHRQSSPQPERLNLRDA